MWIRSVLVTGGIVTAGALAVSAWIASPLEADLELPAPLEAWAGDSGSGASEYNKDLLPLSNNFRPQIYRSYCGPASLSTVLSAYGSIHSNQADIFPSLPSKLNAFYTGLTLTELAQLAKLAGLDGEVAHADTLNLDTFRERLKSNLRREGDFVLVNYDRRVLKQSGAGHISPVGAYDATRDAFLILDEAAYRYPFTWVPAELLYEAVHTLDGEHYRGVLFIASYRRPTE